MGSVASSSAADRAAAPAASVLGDLLAAYGLPPAGVTAVGVGRGRIHRTWRLTTRAGSFLLQQVNTQVFRDVAGLGANTRLVTDRLAQAVTAAPPPASRPVRPFLRLRCTAADAPLWRHADGTWWRLYHFIDGCAAPAPPGPTLAQVFEAAQRFGEFLVAVSTIDASALAQTIPAFHDTPRRHRECEQAAADDPLGRAAGAAHLLRAARDRRPLAQAIEPLLHDGTLPQRTVHNDCKLDNALFDAATGEALCVVDIDTVMSGGTALYDVGDLIRSAAAVSGEDDGTDIAVDPERFDAVVRGYLAGAGALLSRAEIDRFVTGAKVITFELALRFLTDHLLGDSYFGGRAGENLRRAERQFALLASLEAQAPALEALARAAARRA